jgi:hypothetical protein
MNRTSGKVSGKSVSLTAMGSSYTIVCGASSMGLRFSEPGDIITGKYMGIGSPQYLRDEKREKREKREEREERRRERREREG